MPMLLHGDAAFAGQGIVAETLNLYALEGYSTGGTLHLITNNQVGFTTDPAQGRSTRHSSDLAKGFDTPIIHVNADDPEAAISAVRLALAYRGAVRPRRRDRPRRLPPLRPQRAGRAGLHPAADGRPRSSAIRPCASSTAPGSSREGRSPRRRPSGWRTRSRPACARPTSGCAPRSATRCPPKSARRGRAARGQERRSRRGSGRKRLRRLTKQLLRVPEGFTVNPKLAKQLERRRGRARGGRHRLGPRRVARVRLAAPRRASRSG